MEEDGRSRRDLRNRGPDWNGARERACAKAREPSRPARLTSLQPCDGESYSAISGLKHAGTRH